MLVPQIRAVFAALVFAALPAAAADQPPAPPIKPALHTDVPIKPNASQAMPAADMAAPPPAAPAKKASHHKKHHKKATTPVAPTPPPIKPDAAAAPTPATPPPPPIKP